MLSPLRNDEHLTGLAEQRALPLDHRLVLARNFLGLGTCDACLICERRSLDKGLLDGSDPKISVHGASMATRATGGRPRRRRSYHLRCRDSQHSAGSSTWALALRPCLGTRARATAAIVGAEHLLWRLHHLFLLVQKGCCAGELILQVYQLLVLHRHCSDSKGGPHLELA